MRTFLVMMLPESNERGADRESSPREQKNVKSTRIDSPPLTLWQIGCLQEKTKDTLPLAKRH